MTKVLQADGSSTAAYIIKSAYAPLTPPFYIQFDVMIPAALLAALVTAGDTTADLIQLGPLAGALGNDGLFGNHDFSGWHWSSDFGHAGGTFVGDTFYTVNIDYAGTTVTWKINGTTVATDTGVTGLDGSFALGAISPAGVTSQFYYFDNVKVSTVAEGGTDIFSDDFESGTFASWDSTHGAVSIVTYPFPVPAATDGRVLIAFDDGPLVASPTWTQIDNTPNLVAMIEIDVGRQTLNARTDTGTATVHLNDTAGTFDPRNTSSPYFGKLDGKQILLQLQNPVTLLWESQFRGLIDDYGYTIDPASDHLGNPIVANIQIDCVDLFDYLAGYGLTPGLDGFVPPPAGSEGTVWYAATAGNIDDRVIEVLTDTGVDSTRYVVFGLNVSGQAANYNADDDALAVIRDCVDAEFPFIGNAFVDRQGRFCVHGRQSRFTPDSVAAGAGTATWDFQRWKVGDGAAVAADSSRAQMRVLGYSRARSNIINAVLCYPKGIAETDMPNQVFADATSITDYGKHAAPPLNDLVIAAGTTTGNTGKVECQKFAELLVKNQKDPREAITALQLKTVNPADLRASVVWDMLTRADISDVVNVKAGYPGGTGFIGGATADDYYIEGRSLRIEPAAGTYDYVELNLEVSPAIWSMDTHGVF